MTKCIFLFVCLLAAAGSFAVASLRAQQAQAPAPSLHEYAERLKSDDQEDRILAAQEALTSDDVLLRSLALETALQSRNPRLRDVGLHYLVASRGRLVVQVASSPLLTDYIAAVLVEKTPPGPAILAVHAHPSLELRIALPERDGSFSGQSQELGPFLGCVHDGSLDIVFSSGPADRCALEFDSFEQGVMVGELRCQGRVLPAHLELP
jgi:hypothetical protein